jgi:probable rRNA maturation factor
VALSIKHVACVHVTNHNRNYRIDRNKIIKIVSEVSRRLGVAQYEICVQFVSPNKMRSLNKIYRHQDKSTDVLSFPQYDWRRPPKVQKTPSPEVKVLNPLPLGDVVISTSDAALNAAESGHDLSKEICFLLVHGILHLVGHDHMKPAEKRKMFSEQSKLMRIFSGRRPAFPAWSGCAKKIATKRSTKKTKSSPGQKKRAQRKKKSR